MCATASPSSPAAPPTALSTRLAPHLPCRAQPSLGGLGFPPHLHTAVHPGSSPCKSQHRHPPNLQGLSRLRFLSPCLFLCVTHHNLQLVTGGYLYCLSFPTRNIRDFLRVGNPSCHSSRRPQSLEPGGTQRERVNICGLSEKCFFFLKKSGSTPNHFQFGAA